MGLKLVLLSRWTPNFILKRELDHVYIVTSSALESLLNASNPNGVTSKVIMPLEGNLKEKRTAMAKEHNRLVEILVGVLGRDEAIRLGRETLFTVGSQLGKETRLKLGANYSFNDLIRSAKVLYRILGISFNLEKISNGTASLTINRCALAKDYSELTCQVLSATDEGVISGLNPNITMSFTQKMTSGCQVCKAKIIAKTDGGV